MKKKHHHHAFTLVELLVVIAIIGVLVAMGIPAIQAARETANRSLCQRRLSQLIVAVHHYEMAHGVYPPGVLDPQGPIQNQPHGFHHNWLGHLLPYLDHNNAYLAIDRQVGVYHDNNRQIREMTFSVFQCASSASPRGNIGNHSDYAGVHHETEAPINSDNHGVFFLNSYLRYEDVPDGISHTLFIGEKFPDGVDLGWMSGTRATLRNTGEAPDSLGPSVNAVAPKPSTVGGFGSYHSHAVNFAFGDGSVRLLHSNVDLTVLRQMAHRADGKPLESYGY